MAKFILVYERIGSITLFMDMDKLFLLGTLQGIVS